MTTNRLMNVEILLPELITEINAVKHKSVVKLKPFKLECIR